jgi:hypothetical protein
VERALAYVIGVILLCDLAVVGVHLLDERTSLVSGVPAVERRGPDEVEVVPGEGQAFVRGTAERVVAEQAQVQALKTPLTITAVERGEGRLEIEQAIVGGRRVTISWDGGTPLPLSGGGELVLGATYVEVGPEGAMYRLDGAPRRFTAGTYTAGAAVGVGEAGIAAPRDSVRFTADDQTVLVSRGGVVVRRDPAPLDLLGPGAVLVEGSLDVQWPDRRQEVTRVTFDGGPYRVTVTPGGGRTSIDAIFQGRLDIA